VFAVADGDETTIESDAYLTNWGGDGDQSIFKRLEASDGTPGIKIGLLLKTIFGSGLMYVFYTIISYLRGLAESYRSLIEAGFSFLNDLVAVLFGDGSFVSGGPKLAVMSGPADYLSSLFENAEQTLSGEALGFLIGFSLILALATVVWGVRRYAL
jgi:hypothetical protein